MQFGIFCWTCAYRNADTWLTVDSVDIISGRGWPAQDEQLEECKMACGLIRIENMNKLYTGTRQ